MIHSCLVCVCALVCAALVCAALVCVALVCVALVCVALVCVCWCVLRWCVFVCVCVGDLVVFQATDPAVCPREGRESIWSLKTGLDDLGVAPWIGHLHIYMGICWI